MEIEKLVVEATKGNKTALEGVVSSIQDNIYYLALRMLADPDDALDATQEILLKIVTNLSTFRFESQFNTWVHRIAVNHLISDKKLREKNAELNFDLFKKDLESDLTPHSGWEEDPQYIVLLNELRISCTMAMLLCLKPSIRMAYILGDIFDLEHGEASEALSISKENFRKRLSRARADVLEFTSQSCGLVSEHAACRCEKKLNGAIDRKRVVPGNSFFPIEVKFSYDKVKKSLLETQQDLKTLASQNAISHYKCPIKLGEYIESLVSEGISSKKVQFETSCLRNGQR